MFDDDDQRDDARADFFQQVDAQNARANAGMQNAAMQGVPAMPFDLRREVFTPTVGQFGVPPPVKTPRTTMSGPSVAPVVTIPEPLQEMVPAESGGDLNDLD